MKEVIDQRTVYGMDHAEISLWVTNVPCTTHYTFGQATMNIMLEGLKEVHFDGFQIDFTGNSFLVPPQGTEITVHIRDTSFDNPTTCLSLDISQEYLGKLFDEINSKHQLHWDAIDLDLDLEGKQQFYTKNQVLYDAFLNLYNCRKNSTKAQSFLWELRLKELLFQLLQTRVGKQLLSTNPKSLLPWVSEVSYHIKKNYRKSLKMSDLVQKSGMNEASFFKHFKLHFGCTPGEFIINYRIKRAEEALKTTNKPIKEVAYDNGFNSVAYFNRKFKSTTGHTPTQFRTDKNLAIRSMD